MAVPAKKEFAIVGLQHAHTRAAVNGLLTLGWRPVSIWEPEPDYLARKFAEDLKVEVSSEGDFYRALERTDAPVVLTSARLDYRGELIAAAVKLGKAVVADKPLCTSLEHCAAIEAAAKEGGGTAVCQFEFRYQPLVRLLWRRLCAGELGRLVGFFGNGPHKLNKATRPAWFFDPRINPGVLVDLACHNADIFLWMAGSSAGAAAAEVKSVNAWETSVRYGDLNLIDFGQADLHLAGGATGVFRGDWLTPEKYPFYGDTRFLVTGTEGQAEMLFHGPADEAARKSAVPAARLFSDRTAPQRLSPEPLRAAGTEETGLRATFMGEFLAHVFEGAPTHLSMADCLRTTRATLQAKQAAAEVAAAVTG